MGEIYRIDDGTSSIDISPIRGQNEPENRGRDIIRAKDGKEDAHEWGGKDVYETPFNNVSKAEADLLIDWWENMTTLTFTPDLQGAPGTTLEVKIAEMKRPMQMWGGDWDTLFAGLLTLYQISSISFSSSSQSVSGSTSCSSLSDSSSCSTGSSKSCSVFLISVSQSSSQGIDNVSVSLSSCENLSVSSCSLSVSISGSVGVSLLSCSDSVSRSCSTSVSVSESESVGVIGVSFTSQSCSNDPAGDISCSLSAGGQSCSLSGAG
jgi:hypothetical protein